MNGLGTLQIIKLDALEAAPDARRAEYLAVAIGNSATEGVIRKDYPWNDITGLQELVAVGDERLGVPSGLISVIRARAIERTVVDKLPSTKAAPTLWFELVQSLILTSDASTQYVITRNEAGEPDITLEDNGLGSAVTQPALRTRRRPIVQFAPFNDLHPPRRLIPARAQAGASPFYIAATGRELVSEVEQLPALEGWLRTLGPKTGRS